MTNLTPEQIREAVELAENEKLREDAFNAQELGILLDCLLQVDWADTAPQLRKKLKRMEALAAVEQSEGLHSHEVPSEVAETLDAALRDSVTVLDESECERLGYHVCGPKRGTDQ